MEHLKETMKKYLFIQTQSQSNMEQNRLTLGKVCEERESERVCVMREKRECVQKKEEEREGLKRENRSREARECVRVLRP